MNSVAFYTSGCRLNQYETQAVREQFETAGYQSVHFQQKADVYVINTCTVTEKADQECRRLIRRAKELNKDAKVIVIGCYSQLHADQIKHIDGVSAVFGNVEKSHLLQLISDIPKKDTFIQIADIGQQHTFEPLSLSKYVSMTRAYLKIQDGCSLACTFCAVKLARGPNRSRPIVDILAEAQRLLNNGYQELVLTGVHIGSYGKDHKNQRLTILDVAQKIVEFDKLKRLRFSSLSPQSLTEELIQFIANHAKVCLHFHIPLQSGDDEILKKMRRSYNRDMFIDKIMQIHQLMPTAAIGSDVIVGFPGETDYHFARTADLIEQLPFSYLHVFPFSARPNTPAATMPEQVAEKVKLERSQVLRQIAISKKQQFIQSYVGKTLTVLAESRFDKYKRLTGLTDNYIRVSFEGDTQLMNQLVPVRLLKCENGYAVGEKDEQAKPSNLLHD